jgi:basic membrane protein A
VTNFLTFHALAVRCRLPALSKLRRSCIEGFAVSFLLLTACTADPPPSDDAFRVIMVMDMAGLGDKGFNDAGWQGVQRAIAELGIKGEYLQSSEQADYIPNLNLAAQQADAVLAMGFLMIDAIKIVAPLHPDTKFIFVDGRIDGQNIASFDFKAQEGAYLAGIIAAMTTRTGKVGTVIGMDIPPVRAYEAGFLAGIETVRFLEQKRVDYLSASVGDFNNPSRAKSLAQGMIGRGADIVLQLAGNSGLGVIEAARDAGDSVYAIGADLDQDDLTPGNVLVSILKRIDIAVYEAIRSAVEGTFEPGHHLLGLAEEATGLSRMRHTRHLVSARASEMVKRAGDGIREGQIAVPARMEEVEGFVVPGL